MRITTELKTFLEENIHLIEDNNFSELYYRWENKNISHYALKELSTALRSAGIDVLPFMDGVLPPYYYAYKKLDSNRLIVPESVRIVQPYGLSGLYSTITELVIPHTCKELRYNAVSENGSLEKISLEDGVQTISSRCFADCTNLHDIYVPSSVTTIGMHGVFADCSKLLTIHCEQGSTMEAYCEQNGLHYKSY